MAELDALLKTLRRGGIDRPDFKPTASPVKTVAVNTNFTSTPAPSAPVQPLAPQAPTPPPQPARSNVDQLVSALAGFSNNFNRFVGQHFAEENKQAGVDAELKYLQDNSPLSWAEAVKKDPTLADRSPVFRQVYESRAARTAVQRRAGELIAKYHTSPIAGSEDPAAITGWLQENMKDLYEMQTSPAAREALVEEMRSVSAKFISGHAEVARKNLVEKNANSLSVSYQTTFDNYKALGPAVAYKTEDPVAYERLKASGDKHAGVKAAFLNGISGGESAGKYNIRYTPSGGALYSDMNQHPRIRETIPKGPNAGKTSDAAGRYQFLSSTWDALMGKNTPFTPENQDLAAIKLAEQDYKRRTGKNLWDELEKRGFQPDIQAALAPTWEALNGNRGRHLATYNESLKRYGGTPAGPGVTNAHIPEMVEEVRKLEREATAQGMTVGQINEITLNAVVTNAIQNQDESILEVASLTRPHGLSIEQKKAVEDARVKIRALKVQEANHQAKVEKAAKEAREAHVVTSVASHLLQQMKTGPNGEPPQAPRVPQQILEAALEEDKVHGTDIFNGLVKMQENLDKLDKNEDRLAVGDLTASVYSGKAGQREVLKAIQDGILKDHVTISRLLEFSGRKGGDNPLNDPGVSHLVSSIENVIGKKEGAIGAFKDPVAASQALSMFTGGMLKFKAENPTASPIQLHEEAKKLHMEVMKLYAPREAAKLEGKTPEALKAGAATAPDANKPVIVPRKVEWRKAPVYSDEATLRKEWEAFQKGDFNNDFAKWMKANDLIGNPKAISEFIEAQTKLLKNQPKR